MTAIDTELLTIRIAFDHTDRELRFIFPATMLLPNSMRVVDAVGASLAAIICSTFNGEGESGRVALKLGKRLLDLAETKELLLQDVIGNQQATMTVEFEPDEVDD